MKKVLSLLLALFMVLSLCVTAFAGSTTAHTITINNSSAAKHTYSAYQVFSGELSDGKLSNIDWGAGVNGEAILTALKADTAFEKDSVNLFAKSSSAADVAEVLDDYADDSDFAKAFADVVGKNLSTTVAGTSTEDKTPYTINVTGDGYYLIKDSAEPTYAEDSQTRDTLTDYILKVVGDVTVTAKSGTVTVEKKVATGDKTCTNTDADHVHTSDCFTYDDENTAQIGDVVSYKITSTIPAEASAFDYYYFILGDTLSSGLDFVSTSVKVTIGGDDAVKDTDYTVSTSYKTYTFAVALEDAKDNAGKEVVVTYEATVNKNAVIGNEGNDNKVKVEFSKNPNTEYGGGTDKKPPEGGFPAEGGVTPDGETPEDITKTYVTQITILKVDGSDTDKKLSGAVFSVTGTTTPVIVHTKDVYEEAANGSYYKLKDGSYTEDVPQTEKMETADDRTAGYVVTDDLSKAVYTINGTSYRVANEAELEDTSIALYKYMASNEYLYESTTTKYTKTTTTNITDGAAETYSATATTDSNGNIVLTGLNAGKYVITELKAPDGYNLLTESVTINVGTETKDGKFNWTFKGLTGEALSTVNDDGTLTFTIENNSGSILPSTGGIGTTIFYVLGGVLVLGAAVLLITRKRVGEEK